MGSLSDSVQLFVSTHTVLPDGTSRNDLYAATTTLSGYVADLSTFSTPVFNAVTNEVAASGGFTNIRLEVGIGQQNTGQRQLYNYSGGGFAVATPVIKYHLAWQDVKKGTDLTARSDVVTWITGILQKLTPVNLYPDVNY